MRLVNQRETVWVQPLIDFDRQPSELERSEALERAIRRHGCRLSDVLEELESENRTLDRLYGEIRVPAGSEVSDSSDESWRDRPPTDFSPI